MDRNVSASAYYSPSPVALRKESVDRNFRHHSLNLPSSPSLSARRAWIEIEAPTTQDCRHAQSLSARRAWIEILASRLADMSAASLSARRAWIEIIDDLEPSTTRKSLSARRAWIEISLLVYLALIRYRRSPQGERG